MRVLVTGSRDWADKEHVAEALIEAWEQALEGEFPTLVSGACPTGADAIAEALAEEWGWPVERHPADWARHGKAAGPLRNREMVERGADVCLAFPLGVSRGTRGCMALAKAAGIEVRNYGEDA